MAKLMCSWLRVGLGLQCLWVGGPGEQWGLGLSSQDRGRGSGSLGKVLLATPLPRAS